MLTTTTVYEDYSQQQHFRTVLGKTPLTNHRLSPLWVRVPQMAMLSICPNMTLAVERDVKRQFLLVLLISAMYKLLKHNKDKPKRYLASLPSHFMCSNVLASLNNVLTCKCQASGMQGKDKTCAGIFIMKTACQDTLVKCVNDFRCGCGNN